MIKMFIACLHIIYRKIFAVFGNNRVILQNKYYVSDKIYQRELKQLFYKLWIFVGISTEIPKDKSWMLRKIGPKEVILFRDGEEIRCFENVCAHKNMRICSSEFGRGVLACPYHGWVYEPGGELRKVPFENQSYKYSENELNSLGLNAYKVTLLGSMIFVCLSKAPIKIERQFPSYILRSLKLTSKGWSSHVHHSCEERNFNWKLNFENLRDPLHPLFLHQKSLASEVDFSSSFSEFPPVEKGLVFTRLPNISTFSLDGKSKSNSLPSYDKMFRRNFSEGYYNWLLFPNFHMASPDGGRTFNLEVFNPIAADKVEIKKFWVMNKPRKEINATEFLEQREVAGRQVLDEDFDANEEVQKALTTADTNAYVGAYEAWNINIARAYKRLMAGILF